MKIHLVTAEHFRDAGLIQRAFAGADAANADAADLVNLMRKDSGWDCRTMASPKSWEVFLLELQDHHGAAHCYVEIAEIEVAGGEGMVVKAYEPALPGEIGDARSAYADDDLEIDDDAAVSRADDGYWVSAWVWIAGDDDGED